MSRGTKAGLLVFPCQQKRCNSQGSKTRDVMNPSSIRMGRSRGGSHLLTPCPHLTACSFSLHTSRPTPGAQEVQQGAQTSALVQDGKLHSSSWHDTRMGQHNRICGVMVASQVPYRIRDLSALVALHHNLQLILSNDEPSRATCGPIGLVRSAQKP